MRYARDLALALDWREVKRLRSTNRESGKIWTRCNFLPSVMKSLAEIFVMTITWPSSPPLSSFSITSNPKGLAKRMLCKARWCKVPFVSFKRRWKSHFCVLAEGFERFCLAAPNWSDGRRITWERGVLCWRICNDILPCSRAPRQLSSPDKDESKVCKLARLF